MGIFDQHIEYASEKNPIKGILVRSSSGEYEIWFPYSIENVKMLKMNLLLGVENVSSLRKDPMPGLDDNRYSIIRITKIDIHHSLINQVSETKGPISIIKLIEEDSTHWNRSVLDAEVENLRIIVKAESTGKDVYYPGSLEGPNQDPKIKDSITEPSQGGIVYLWKGVIVDSFLNGGFSGTENINSIEIGRHRDYSNPYVPIIMDINEMLVKHFGIFGATGSGKSNLLSTLFYKIMNKDEARHIVLFDVNNEYFGLLFDLLLKCDVQIVLLEDPNYFGSNVKEYLYGNLLCMNRAAVDIYEQLTYSKALKNLFKKEIYRDRIISLIGYLLAKGQVKVFTTDMSGKNIGYFLEKISVEYFEKNKYSSGTGMRLKNEISRNMFDKLKDIYSANMVASSAHLKRFTDLLEDIRNYYKNNDKDELAHKGEIIVEYMTSLENKDNFYKDYYGFLDGLIKYIKSLLPETEHGPDCVFKMNLVGFWNEVHGKHKSVTLVLGESNHLRYGADIFGNSTYHIRKKRGITDPPVLFMFDEADVFISSRNVGGEEEDTAAIQKSRSVAKTIAKRGRKYGIGLGLSTQRIKYLDTEIMSQPQTYFVGKLMRRGDRSTVTEAFGIDDNVINPEGLKVGEWIVISHSALGQKAEPIPVRFDNADERLIKFIADDKIFMEEDIVRVAKSIEFFNDLGQQNSIFSIVVENTEYIPSVIL